MSDETVRVLIVDDDPDVRLTLDQLLSTDPSIRVIGRAKDGHQALAALRKHPVDVILLDVRMPRLDGLATLESVRRDGLAVRVLILTTFGEANYVRRAIAAQADGFLLKSGDPRHLIEAVRGTSGGAWLSPPIAGIVADDLRRSLAGKTETTQARQLLIELTSRERDVAQHLARGLSNAEIGHQLHLSESTVKAYLGSAMARCGARNRVALAALVWRADQPTEPG